MNPYEKVVGGKRGAFFIVFAIVTGVLVLSSYWVVSFVNSTVRDDEPTVINDEISPIYVDFFTDVDDHISAESYLAMAEYQQEFPQPQNVQVLEGLNTQEINGYMMNHFVAGLRVNCTYCHSLENFAADEWGDPVAEQRKMTARRHLVLTQDLNRNWLDPELLLALAPQKKSSGAVMSCAVCHNGQAQPNPWPADDSVLPDDFRLPLDADLTAENQGILNVNARSDISLDTVQYQQNVMYHMNNSMNVGCTHCHNSRYFPSREVPAIHYAQHMLLMTQDIWNEYAESFNFNEPSCKMCHQGYVIPPGAAQSAAVMPDALVAQSE
jgi:photosynthetic reaction center cytochrome c subunit